MTTDTKCNLTIEDLEIIMEALAYLPLYHGRHHSTEKIKQTWDKIHHQFTLGVKS